MPNDGTLLTGGCMCGAVRFEVTAPLAGAAYCHCKRCQRRTGTAFSVSGLTQPGSFTVTEGPEHIGTYRPGGDGWNKSFCRECGSQLFTANPADDTLIAVRLGAPRRRSGRPAGRPPVRRLRAGLGARCPTTGSPASPSA
jgi:hypothetical protein